MAWMNTVSFFSRLSIPHQPLLVSVLICVSLLFTSSHERWWWGHACICLANSLFIVCVNFDYIVVNVNHVVCLCDLNFSLHQYLLRRLPSLKDCTILMPTWGTLKDFGMEAHTWATGIRPVNQMPQAWPPSRWPSYQSTGWAVVMVNTTMQLMHCGLWEITCSGMLYHCQDLQSIKFAKPFSWVQTVYQIS